jgi:dimethylargininase
LYCCKSRLNNNEFTSIIDLLLKRVIICPPIDEYFAIRDKKLHNITQAAEINKAIQQHENLRKVLSGSGCEVILIPELAGHPNSVFTRDPSVVTPKGYIKLQMGLESRRGEEDWMAQYLESLGIKRAGSISGNGTVEGGDVIINGSIAFVGQSKRTNEEGVNQISSIFNAMNFEVRSIKVPQPFLHLGGAMSALSSDYILCCQGIFPIDFFNGLNRIEVPRADFVTGNVISLGNHEIIAEQMNTTAINILKQKGYRVHQLDLSEFIKGTGGPTCLILPV